MQRSMPHAKRRYSARRRSNELSTSQIRRDIARQGTQYVDDGRDAALLLPPKRPYEPPPWLMKDAHVRLATGPFRLVLMDPFRITPKGAWVTLISGVRGWVACETLRMS